MARFKQRDRSTQRRRIRFVSVVFFGLVFNLLGTTTTTGFEFNGNGSINRRHVLQKCTLVAALGGQVGIKPCLAVDGEFVYSDSWTGTNLPLLPIWEATEESNIVFDDDHDDNATTNGLSCWSMGRWPDPILRRPAQQVPSLLFGTEQLQKACELLRNTAVVNAAVGLAAQQCGVNARIIFLEQQGRRPFLPNNGKTGLVLINPQIIQRSPEMDMRVWREECLVLPTSFRATVLRDAWVDVKFQHPNGKKDQVRLKGETARALQHEYDHDRGILITDHLDLSELENDLMRRIESDGHEQRMQIAYTRQIDN